MSGNLNYALEASQASIPRYLRKDSPIAGASNRGFVSDSPLPTYGVTTYNAEERLN